MNREENEARIESARDDVDRCNHGDMLVCIFPAKIERRKKGGKEQRGQVTPSQAPEDTCLFNLLTRSFFQAFLIDCALV